VKIDDSLDVLAEHGIAGILGLLANAIFGDSSIIGLDGVNGNYAYKGGFVKHNWKQLYIQFTYICACAAYAFIMSAIIAFVINFIPGLHLRASEEAELLGMDDDQLGEFAYDYVEVRRDYLAWTPATAEPGASGDIPQGERHGIPQHSEMLGGQGKDANENEGSESEKAGNAHTGVGGDRHAIAGHQG
jgi:Amt family ammonium transporter